MLQVRKIVRQLETQIDRGKFTDEPNEKLQSVDQFLSESLYRFRVRESQRLRLVSRNIGALHTTWSAVYRSASCQDEREG